MKIPFGEYAPDRATFDNPGVDMNNVLYTGDHWEPMPALNPSGAALGTRVLAGLGAISSGGTARMYAGIALRLYRQSGTTWTDASRGGVDYTVSTPSTWQMIQSGTYVIATNFADEIQYTDITTANAFANIAGADTPRAKRVGQLSRHLVVGHTYDSTDGTVPNRVWWPAIDAPLTWPARGTAAAAAALSDYQDLEESYGKVQAIVGFEFGVIFQERAVHRMSFVGAPEIYQFDLVDKNRGCLCPNAVVQVGRQIFYISDEGFHSTDGTSASAPIGDGRVDKEFLSRVRADKVESVTATVDTVKKCIYWAYPSTDESGDYNNEILIYNYRQDKWSHGQDRIDTYVNASVSASIDLEGMDVYGTVDAQTVSWDSPLFLGGQRTIAGFNSDHKLSTIDGVTTSSKMTTGDFSDPNGTLMIVTGVRAVMEAGSPTVRVGSRRLPSDAITYTGAKIPNTRTGYADCRRQGFYHRIEVTTSGNFGKATGIVLRQQPDGMA